MIKRKISIFIHNKVICNCLIIVSFLIISLLSYAILYRSGYLMGFYDDSFHFKRILELKTSFLHGSFLPRYSFNQFHGSEIMTFYPYLNLFPIVFISMLISSKIAVIDIWMVMNTFLALLGSYYGCYSYDHSKRVSYVFSVIYTTSVYMMCGGQGFNGFGIATSCIALPLILFGCLKLVKFGQYVELSLGLTLMAYSHVLNSFTSILFVALLLILNLHAVSFKKIVNTVKCGILTLLLTSIVWLPIIIADKTNRFALAFPGQSHGVTGYPLQNILQGSFSINYFNVNLSIFAVIGIILGITFYKYMSPVLKRVFIVALLFIYLCSDWFPWKRMPNVIINIFSRYQHISRMFIVPQVILCYLFAVIILRYLKIYVKHFDQANLIAGSLVIVALLFQLNTQQDMKSRWLKSPTINETYYLRHRNLKQMEPYKINHQNDLNYLLNSTTTEYDNYFPKNAMSQSKYINRNLGTDDEGKRILVKPIGYNAFGFRVHQRIKHFRLPIVGYNHDPQIWLNHRLVNSQLTRDGQIEISNVPKGLDQIEVTIQSNEKLTIIKVLLYVMGLIWLLASFCKDRIKSKFVK